VRSRPVLVIQHLAPEGPALIAGALERAGRRLDVVRVDAGSDLPADLSGYAGMVVMGGPMSAGSDRGFPTRHAELELLRAALEGGVPTLGVCLGAQLLAVAAGGAIERSGPPEIGWGEVQLTPGAAGDAVFEGPSDTLSVLHWHGETFTLPDGAVRLASSNLYANQAFRLGPCAWGLQFHLEVDRAAVAGFVDAFGDEAEHPEAILRDAPLHLARSELRRTRILDRFAAVVDRVDTAATPSASTDAGSGASTGAATDGPTLPA
jgi:GMP synthase-like glutamine amidotransferase